MTKEQLFARFDETCSREQTLDEHLSNVGSICSDFCTQYPHIAYLLGYIHDLGKACEAFQNRLNTNTGRVDHSTAAGVYLQNLGPSFSADNEQQYCVQVVLDMCSFAAMCHHTGLRDMLILSENGYEDALLCAKFKCQNDKNYGTQYQQVLTFGHEFCEKIDSLVNSQDFIFECHKFVETIYNFIRNHNFNGKTFKFYGGLFIRYMYSCLIDADRTDAYLFDKGRKYIPKSQKIEQNYANFDKISRSLDEYIASCPDSPLKQIRDEIYSFCIHKAKDNSQIFELNVQTGGGKTFSSFRFALQRIAERKAKKIVYVVPYLSIIEQNAEAIRRILQRKNLQDMLVESHSNAVNQKRQDGVEFAPNPKFEPAITVWDEPIVFTTMVSFLESVYCGRTQNNRRLHNLENSVIIFDEIQTLPIKCIALFNGLVNFLASFLNCTIVLCTATQPTLSSLADYRSSSVEKSDSKALSLLPATPIISEKFELLDRTEIIVDSEKSRDIDSIAAVAIEKFRENGNLLLVVNTKKCAKQIFETIKAQNVAKCYHLSTNMCPQHRLDKINAIKNDLSESQPIIVVSTQLIEAGVDLDFACVIRSRAGLESIIQSAGRCNREGNLCDENGDKKKGKVYVVSLDSKLENLAYLPDIAARRGKFDEIYYLNPDNLTGDAAVGEYFRRVYGISSLNQIKYPIPNSNSNAYDLLSYAQFEDYERDTPTRATHERNKLLSVGYQFDTVAQNFHVINEDTVGVLMPYGKGKEYIEKLKSGFAEFDKGMQRFMVNIYRSNLPANLQQADGILYFDGVYDDEIGFTTDLVSLEFEGGIIN